MPTATYHRRLLPSALLLGYAATLVNSQCTLCEDGSEVDPEGTISGMLTCTVLAGVLVGDTATNSTTCIDAQLQGYLFCGCPTYPDVFCAMCSGGATDITAKQKIAFTNQTCAEVLFVKEAELDSCADITQYESLCGCPNAPAAPATCSLCGDGEELTNESTVVDVFGTTCQEVFDYSTFVMTAEECDGVIKPLTGMCCLAPGETRSPTFAPTLAPTHTPSTSPSQSPSTSSEPTSAPSAAFSTMTSSWQWMVTAALGGAVVAAFL
jgi:hypothetical protein